MPFIRSVVALAFFATATVNTVDAEPVEPPPSLCYNYTDLPPVELGPGDCTVRKFNKYTKEMFDYLKEEYPDIKCKGGVKNERKAMTGTLTEEDAEKVVEEMCRLQLAEAAVELTKIDQVIDNVDLQVYYSGYGFLNEETGNFQQDSQDFLDKGGYDKYINISDNPRVNDHYPTSEQSYNAGQAVKNLYLKSTKNYLKAPTDKFECESNTAMCCWGRDRQYYDKNGNCKPGDCARQDPGDNTDLCWTTADDEVYPWPGDKTEGDLHCHGITWGDDDKSGLDINAMAKWNSLFYVSMYDHMYKRGYVGSVTSEPGILGDHPMCGCIEEMPTVARADCNQVTGGANYTLTVVDGMLQIEKVEGTFELEFESCEGYDFVEDFTPEDYLNPKEREELKSSNNDLAAFVFKQYLEGKINSDHVRRVEERLIGYRNPDVNKSDKNRQQACEAAFDEKFGTAYEEIVGDSISA